MTFALLTVILGPSFLNHYVLLTEISFKTILRPARKGLSESLWIAQGCGDDFRHLLGAVRRGASRAWNVGQSVEPFVIKSLEPSTHSAGLHILAFATLMLKSAEDIPA
jgi:hypothetical protein